jgi:hypothetical protein
VAQAAVRHLQGHDCANSCYRCLRSYRNQRVHGVLNWRLALPYLQVAAVSDVVPMAPTPTPTSGEGPEWEEARSEGCESPLKLRLLKAIRAAGLPESQKQHEVYDSRGRLLTRADFAYVTPKRILIYADGMEFHSDLRQRIHDTRQSNQLQTKAGRCCVFLDRTCIETLLIVSHNCRMHLVYEKKDENNERWEDLLAGLKWRDQGGTDSRFSLSADRPYRKVTRSTCFGSGKGQLNKAEVVEGPETDGRSR